MLDIIVTINDPPFLDPINCKRRLAGFIISTPASLRSNSSSDKTSQDMASKILLLVCFFAFLSPLWSLPLPLPNGKNSFRLL